MNARHSLFEGASLGAPGHDAHRSSLRSLSSTLIHHVTAEIRAEPLVILIGVSVVIFYAGVILFLVHL